jgi:hypothetical protein
MQKRLVEIQEEITDTSYILGGKVREFNEVNPEFAVDATQPPELMYYQYCYQVERMLMQKQSAKLAQRVEPAKEVKPVKPVEPVEPADMDDNSTTQVPDNIEEPNLSSQPVEMS